MKEFFRIRTDNLVNVDTVETMPTIDNPEDHPRPAALRSKRLRILEQGGFRDASGSGNVGA